MQNSEIEIMAPVGCWESLAAALEAGATSVYFGIEHLNMRSRSSANFTTEDLHTIVNRCNEVGVKTYLTLNTVMYPEDIPLMREIVYPIPRRSSSTLSMPMWWFWRVS